MCDGLLGSVWALRSRWLFASGLELPSAGWAARKEF
jgi:hypothetical protein